MRKPTFETNYEDLLMGLNNIQDQTRYLKLVVREQANLYTKELDDFLTEVHRIVTDKSKEVSDINLEYIALQLPTMMYFAADGMEDLTIDRDFASKLVKEIFSETVLEENGRVVELQSKAKLASQQAALEEQIISNIRSRVQTRLKYAYDALGTYNKVLSNRSASKYLSRQKTGNGE